MTLKELRDKAQKLVLEMRKLHDEASDPKATPRADWDEHFDRLSAEYDECRSSIDRAEKLEKLEAETRSAQDPARQALGRPMPDQGGRTERRKAVSERVETHGRAMAGWCRSQGGQPSDAEIEAMKEVGFDGRGGEFHLLPTMEARSLQRAWRAGHLSQFEQRAQSALQGSLGGVLIAEGFIPRLEVAMLQFGGMMGVAEVLRTASGEDLPWPTADDTSNSGVQVGEDEESDTDNLTFGRLVLRGYKFSSKIIEVPTELIQDSAISIEQIVGAMLGERLGRILNTKFTTGNGATGPHGLLPAVGATITPDGGNTDAADDILDLVYSIDQAYRSNGTFMCHDTVLAALRKLRDQDGQPILSNGINSGEPSRLAGYPIVSNQDFPSYGEDATGRGTLVFGDLSKYKIRMIQGIRLERDQSISRDVLQFVAYVRADGRYMNAGTNPIKRLDAQIGAAS